MTITDTESKETTESRPVWRHILPAFPAHFGLAALLAVSLVLPLSPLRMVLLAVLSGLSPLLAVRRRWGIAELILVPPQASLIFWCLMALPVLKFGVFAALPALIAALLGENARRRKDTLTLEFTLLDAAGLLALLGMLIPITLVFHANGMQAGKYIAHAWFGRDSFYLFALIQEAIERGGWPTENPFVAGVANFYPSLLHVGCAALTRQSGLIAAESLLLTSPLFLATGLPLLVVAAGRAVGGPLKPISALLVVGATAGAFLLRPDLFIYPQPESYVIGWLALVLWLWGEGVPSRAEVTAALIASFAIVFAHTVTGAACVIFVASRSLDTTRVPETRFRGWLQLSVTLLLSLLFVRLSLLPYSGARGPLSLSPLAESTDFVTPWICPIAVMIFITISGRRDLFRSLGIVALTSLGIAYYVYGSRFIDPIDRWFVYFNAERFLHLAFLITLPFAAARPRQIGLAVALCVILSAFIEPTDLAADSHTLINEAPITVDEGELAVLARIRRDTPPTALILTNFRSFAVPAFTGRSQNQNEINIWAMNTLQPSEFTKRLTDINNFFRLRLPPEKRIAIIDGWGYTHLLLQTPLSPNALPGWLDRQFGPGTMRIVAAEKGYLLLERTHSVPR